MNHRVVRVLLAVAMVTIGGCSEVVEEDTGTRTVTPADVPTVAEPEPDLAPGLTRRGVTNAPDLVAAHERVLASGSYTVSSSIIERFGDGRLRRLKNACARYEGNEYYIAAAFGGTALPVGPDRTRVWSNGDRTLEATTRNGETTYLAGSEERLLDARTRYALGTAESNNLQTLFASIDRATVEAVAVENRGDDANELDRYRITARVFSEPPLSAVRPPETVTNVTFGAIVDSRGLIRSYRLTYAGAIDNRTITGAESVRYTALGTTTVEKPAWGDTATDRNREARTTELGPVGGGCGASAPT